MSQTWRARDQSLASETPAWSPADSPAQQEKPVNRILKTKEDNNLNLWNCPNDIEQIKKKKKKNTYWRKLTKTKNSESPRHLGHDPSLPPHTLIEVPIQVNMAKNMGAPSPRLPVKGYCILLRGSGYQHFSSPPTLSWQGQIPGECYREVGGCLPPPSPDSKHRGSTPGRGWQDHWGSYYSDIISNRGQKFHTITVGPWDQRTWH